MTRPRASRSVAFDRLMPQRAAGFTLIELLAVMSIVTVLMGLGIGFMLRRGSPIEQATAIVRDQVRLAAVTAKSRLAPTEVLVERPEGGRVQLRVRGLEPLAAWHCEPGEQQMNEQVRGDVTGRYVPGRFGMALQPEDDARLTVLRVPTMGRPAWDLRDGFLLRLDLHLEERAACTVAQLGRAFTLSLDDDGTPEVRLALAGGSSKTQGPTRSVKARAPLPLRRWTTLDVVFDGKSLELDVDGRQVGAVPAPGAPFQREGDVFEVSPGQARVAGSIDEIQLFAYVLAEPVDLPLGTELEGLDEGLRFAPTGEPEAACEVVLKNGEQTERHHVAPGGVLQ
ncbi:MAG: LamG-like jellyroll fold domain-containing protein [Planctomycetota bacterium]